MLYIDEIFASIQGESSDAGFPCVFVRLYGCNLKCSFCDQPQDKKSRKKISVEKLINRIRDFHIPNVCITGGEPLLQPEIYSIIYELVNLNYKVSIETNGAVYIEDDPYNRKFKYVMDIKCPSSGMSHKNIYDNLSRLHYIDEVKFVIADRVDYDFAKTIIKNYPTKASILFSPVFDKDMKPVIGKELVQWILEDRLLNVRIQTQLHKILGVL